MVSGLIGFHLLTAISALGLGGVILYCKKGTRQHRILGRCWMVFMLSVTVPSFWIRSLNEGNFSWIHLLTVVTLISMVTAIVGIRLGKVRLHARCMKGSMIGITIAGLFALSPGRLISIVLGY